jgi:hypothetical protein
LGVMTWKDKNNIKKISKMMRLLGNEQHVIAYIIHKADY